MPAIELVSCWFRWADVRRRGHSPASVPEFSREQAHFSAEQPSACPYPRVPAPHANARWSCHRVRPSPQGSSRALRLRAGSVVVVVPCFPRVPASGQRRTTPGSPVAGDARGVVRSLSTAFPQVSPPVLGLGLSWARRWAERSCVTRSAAGFGNRPGPGCQLCNQAHCCWSERCLRLPARAPRRSVRRSTSRCASSADLRRQPLPAVATEPPTHVSGSRTVDSVVVARLGGCAGPVDGRRLAQAVSRQAPSDRRRTDRRRTAPSDSEPRGSSSWTRR